MESLFGNTFFYWILLLGKTANYREILQTGDKGLTNGVI